MANSKDGPPDPWFQEASSPTPLPKGTSSPAPLSKGTSSPTPLSKGSPTPTSSSKATSTPAPLRVDPSIWRPINSNSLNPWNHFQSPQQLHNANLGASHEQGRGVFGNNGGSETAFGPLVPSASYNPPAFPLPVVASNIWRNDRFPPEFHSNNWPTTKTADLNTVAEDQLEPFNNMNFQPYSGHQNGTSSASSASAAPHSVGGHSRTSSFVSQSQFGPSGYQTPQPQIQSPTGPLSPYYPQSSPSSQTDAYSPNQIGAYRPKHLTSAYPPRHLTGAYPPGHPLHSTYSDSPPASSQALTVSSNNARAGRGRAGRGRGGMELGRSSRNSSNHTGRTFTRIRSFLDSGPSSVPTITTSENYKGNWRHEANQSANIPEEESTSLWITHLPPGCTIEMLLSRIVECDKIFATVINDAQPEQNMNCAAAKIVFWTRLGVDRLFQRHRDGLFLFPSPDDPESDTAAHALPLMRPSINMNRTRTRPVPDGPESRVLIIKGHCDIINEANLRDVVFYKKFVWQDDGVQPLLVKQAGAEDEIHFLEWRFGSYRYQASNAYDILMAKIHEGQKALQEAEKMDQAQRRRALEAQQQRIKAQMEKVNNEFLPVILADSHGKFQHMIQDLREQYFAVCNELDKMDQMVAVPPQGFVSHREAEMWAEASVIFGPDPCARYQRKIEY
ncbi:hypothetical protein PG984_011919 [Apiospora sp. TS-2023a]